MNALIEQCRLAGFRLWVEDGTIRYDAPRGAMTPELVTALKTKRLALLDALAHPDPLPPVPRGLAGYATPPGVPPLGDCEGTCAVLFFLCIAYVSIFRACDTLYLVKDQAKAKRYKTTYKVLGVGMIAFPAIAVLLTVVLQPQSEQRPLAFFVEAVGVLIFASYWLVKSREIASTDAERLACEGKLSTKTYQAADIFEEIPVTPVESLRKH